MNHPENIVRNFALDRDLEVQYVDNALVMPAIVASSEEDFRLRGGVYNQSGDFFSLSGRTRLQDAVFIGPYPKNVVVEITAARECCNPAVFCGYIDNGFGHFLLESASRLWWGILNQFRGSYVFQIQKKQIIPAFVTEFFELLGIADQLVLVNEPTLFSQIIIPESAFNIRSIFHPNYLIPFRHIREKLDLINPKSQKKKVYLSRAKLKRRQVVGEETVENMFANNGFEIVSPETLSLTEQIKLVVGAQELAGIIGSALHLLVFTQKINVVYIMPSGIKNSNYAIVDQAVDTIPRNIFAPGKIKRPAFNGFGDTLFYLDLKTVQSKLIGFGYLNAGKVKLPSAESLENLYWSTWNAKSTDK